MANNWLIGLKVVKKLNPSNPGSGNALNTANTMFTWSNDTKKYTPRLLPGKSSAWVVNFSTTAARSAKTKFVAIPANDTQRYDAAPPRKRNELTGTGFAQPNKIPEPEIINIAGTKIEPTGSIWTTGLSDKRPA